jgi:glyoxylase-like metal-dependent hydrolase (beta-lactamase superfamily II)
VYRRDFLTTAAAVAIPLWRSPGLLAGQQQPAVASRRLSDALAVLDLGDSNVLCSSADDRGLVLVDSGSPSSVSRLTTAIRTVRQDAKVHVVFNTHYHSDQTGNNETLAAGGAAIVAHEHTRQWMATDHWVPSDNRYEKARAKAAWPTETFRITGSLNAGTERIDYGHLPLAHTDGDIYVFFRESNVLAVGDVASPLRDPALDYFTGAWIGGRLDAMDTILSLSNDETRIVPAAGLPMTRAEFKVERDMMEEVRSRVWTRVLKGDSPAEMLAAGVLNGLGRTWKDPRKFLHDAAQGMFAHHNKLDPSVI